MREILFSLGLRYWLTMGATLMGATVIAPLIAFRLKGPDRRPSFLRLVGFCSGVVALTVCITLTLSAIAAATVGSSGLSEGWAFIVSGAIFLTLPFALPFLTLARYGAIGRLPIRRRMILTLAIGVGIIAFQMLVLAGVGKVRAEAKQVIDAARLSGIGKGLALYHGEHHEYPSDLRRLVDEGLTIPHDLIPFRSRWRENVTNDQVAPYDGPCGWHYARLADNAPPETLWVWQTPDSHDGDGAYILRFSGHVKWRTPAQFAADLRNSQPHFTKPVREPSVRAAMEQPAPIDAPAIPAD